MTPMDPGLSVPPLDAERFRGSFRHFRSVKQLALDRKLLHVGGEEVNLHSLHEEFMRHRGYDPGEVCGFSLHSRPGAMLSAKYLERAEFLAGDRHKTRLHPVTRHGTHRWDDSGSTIRDLQTLPSRVRPDLCGVVCPGTPRPAKAAGARARLIR